MNIVRVDSKSLKFENIEIRSANIADLLMAERIAGSSEGLNYALALLSQVATFDGKKLVMEDLKDMAAQDFLHLSQELLNAGLDDLKNQLSPSQDTADSTIPQS